MPVVCFIICFRRSEPGASKRAAVSDEKAVAREVLGRHYSDIDDETSSDSEQEFETAPSDTVSFTTLGHVPKYHHQETPSTTTESSESEEVFSGSTSASDSSAQDSDDNTAYYKAPAQQVAHRRSQRTKPRDSNVSAAKACKHKAPSLAKQRRQSSGGESPSTRDSLNIHVDTGVDTRQLRCRKTSVPVKELESSNSDYLEMISESETSSWSEEGEN